MKLVIKLFQCIQKFCDTMGFLPSQPNPTRTFRSKTALYVLPPILLFVSTVIFLLTDADSIQESELAVFTLTSVMSSIINIMVMIWNMPSILYVIEKFEEIIEKSKWEWRRFKWRNANNKVRFDLFWVTESHDPIAMSKYSELNKKIELLSEIYYFFVVKLTMPGVVLPSFLLTIINYFVYNLDADSYFLPIPIVYVSISIYSNAAWYFQC